MRRLAMSLLLALAATPAIAQAKKEPIALRDHGLDFHVGGIVEVVGSRWRIMVFTSRRRAGQGRPERQYQVEQMLVQYFLPQKKTGQLPLSCCGTAAACRRHLRDRGRDGGDGSMTISFAGLGHLRVGRDGASPLRPDQHVRGRARRCPCRSAVRRSVSTWGRSVVERRSGEARFLSGYRSFPPRPIAVHEAGRPRWVTTVTRVRKGLHRTGRQGLPVVVLVHSQSGTFGYKVLEARPDKVKALIAVEPNGRRRSNKAALVKSTPIVVVIGDNAESIRAGRTPPEQRQLRRDVQGRGRQPRSGRSARRWHQGQFAHGDDGQDQRSGRRPDPEVARVEGTGRLHR